MLRKDYMMKKTITILLSIVLLSTLITGCSPVNQDSKAGETLTDDPTLKVALCLTGPINDRDWNAMAYNGLLEIEKNHDVEINYYESIPKSDMEGVIRDYAINDYDVIFGHGFEFADPMELVAAEFPDVIFIVNSAEVYNGSNLASLNVRNIEQGFLAGSLAALFSDSNHVGAIAGMQIPPMEETLKGFVNGAKYVRGDIEISTGYLGSFDDAAKLKEMMTQYIVSEGVDVGVMVADQAALGGIEAIVDNEAKCIGLNFDQSTFAPEHVIISVGQSYARAMDHVFSKIDSGDFESKHYSMGLNEECYFLIENKDYEISTEKKEKINEILEGIMNETINIYE